MFALNALLFAALSGLVAGAVHVFSGPDHLAAIAPLSLHRKGRGWVTGARWGLGHASGVLFVGLASLLFREMIQVDLISSWAERLVGIALLGIGFWGLRKAFSSRLHAHEHSHDGETHVHLHVHGHADAHSHQRGAPHSHTHAAFAVGTLHGVAGSSHIVGVLPALAFPEKSQAIGYLLAYGIGTIVAMSSFSTVISAIARRAAFSTAAAWRGLTVGCSFFAIGLGAYWLIG